MSQWLKKRKCAMFSDYLHPSVVLSVKQPNIIEGAMRQGVTTKEPEGAPSICEERMAEPGQHLAQMIKALREVLRVEEFSEHHLFFLQFYRTVLPSPTSETDAPSITLKN